MKAFLTVLALLALSVSTLAEAQGRGGRGGGGPASVFVADVETRTFATRIEALGTLAAKERVDLSVNAADRVTAVYFDDGQRVRKGQTLLSQAQREQVALVEAAEAAVAETRSALDRRTRLRDSDAISTSALEQARRDYDSAQANLRAVQSRQKDRILVAPFDGVLGFRQVSVGAYLRPGDIVATLVDDSEMRLEFTVPSLFITDVKTGTQIVAKTSDLPGRSFEGQVTSVDNAIDPVTRSFRVRATLPNPDGILRAGMFMMVDVQASPQNGLSVPENAIQPQGPDNYVFVARQEGDQLVARRTKVELGQRQRGYVQVISGLKAGEKVITEGLIRVREGAPVVVRDPSMLDPSAAPASRGGGAAPGVAPGR